MIEGINKETIIFFNAQAGESNKDCIGCFFYDYQRKSKGKFDYGCPLMAICEDGGRWETVQLDNIKKELGEAIVSKMAANSAISMIKDCCTCKGGN